MTKTLAELDAERAAFLDKDLVDNKEALDERLRLIEKQNAAELARFPAAPAPKPKAAKK